MLKIQAFSRNIFTHTCFKSAQKEAERPRPVQNSPKERSARDRCWKRDVCARSQRMRQDAQRQCLRHLERAPIPPLPQQTRGHQQRDRLPPMRRLRLRQPSMLHPETMQARLPLRGLLLRRARRAAPLAQPDFQDGEIRGGDPADAPGLAKGGGADFEELLPGFGPELGHHGVVEV